MTVTVIEIEENKPTKTELVEIQAARTERVVTETTNTKLIQGHMLLGILMTVTHTFSLFLQSFITRTHKE